MHGGLFHRFTGQYYVFLPNRYVYHVISLVFSGLFIRIIDMFDMNLNV